MKKTLSLVLAVLLICSCFTTAAFAADPVKPATPKLISVKNDYSGITIKWSAAKNATGYNVYRKVNSSGWKLIRTLKGADKSTYTDTSVKTANKYTYTVRALNDTVKGGCDPQGLSVVYVPRVYMKSCANVSTGCKINWIAKTDVDGYRIYRKSANGWDRIATIKNASTNSFIDKNVTSGKAYTYTMRAYVGSASGIYDTTGLSQKYLAAPTITSNSKSGANNKLKWNKVSGASSYYIYRKPLNAGWKKIAEVSGTSYTDNASASTVFTYTVKAVNGNALSANASSKTPWNMNSKANIFNFYKCSANAIKYGVAGYTYNYSGVKSDFYIDGEKQDDYCSAFTHKYAKGSDDAIGSFPMCTLTNLDKITTYSVEDKGSYYIIRMKLAPEKNITSYSKSYINQISFCGITKGSIMGDEPASHFRSVDFTNTLNITAAIYKTGKLSAVYFWMKCPVSVKYIADDGDINFKYTINASDKYSSFKY